MSVLTQPLQLALLSGDELRRRDVRHDRGEPGRPAGQLGNQPPRGQAPQDSRDTAPGDPELGCQVGNGGLLAEGQRLIDALLRLEYAHHAPHSVRHVRDTCGRPVMRGWIGTSPERRLAPVRYITLRGGHVVRATPGHWAA